MSRGGHGLNWARAHDSAAQSQTRYCNGVAGLMWGWVFISNLDVVG